MPEGGQVAGIPRGADAACGAGRCRAWPRGDRGVGAGTGAVFPNAACEAAGARIVGTAEEAVAKADLIVKVREPQAAEREMLREGWRQAYTDDPHLERPQRPRRPPDPGRARGIDVLSPHLALKV